MAPNDAAHAIGMALLALGDGNVSRHLDEIIPLDDAAPVSGTWCFDVFRALLEIMEAARDPRTLIIVIPVSISDQLSIDRGISIAGMTAGPAPPTIYLFGGDDPFAPAHEEFRLRLATPDQAKNICVAYRSWRDDRAAQFGWEYNNDVYLWSNKASPQPVR